ncbi:Ig-like domain-containing domain [Soonwooa sp.]|uniref:Ig-like domain-containing domain n=1 Tax=Soonwooa sp. TaxID=1938592 RepID=UPI00262D0384|nr:Ig-like domain-containing domain [Soonwooa sp.]
MKKIFFLFLFGLLVVSCARVGSPNGGAKDTIPPKMLSSNIDTTRVNVPTTLKELRINFDEYIKLKDINKNLIISPPIKNIKKILPANLGTKFLSIQWSDTLKANTTYNFNFGNSITDLNEANPLPYFNFAFSTGSEIEDNYISGTLIDALGEKKSEGKDVNYVVGLYQVKDSMDYRQKPYYITNVDPDGYFELNYLSPGKYKILAFEDLNQNSIFDNGKEKFAFSKDVINIEDKKNISGMKIKLFPSKPAVKYKEYKQTNGGLVLIYDGKPEKVEVSSASPNLTDFKVTHQAKSDSVYVWFDAVAQKIGVEKSDNVKLAAKTSVKTDTISTYYKYDPKVEMTLASTGEKVLPPNTVFKIKSNFALSEIQSDKWKLTSDSISQSFTASISKTNSEDIIVNSDFKVGKSYQLSIPKETVKSFYKSIAKSYRLDFEIGKPADYGSLKVEILNPPTSHFWLQLLNEKGDVMYQEYTKGSQVHFTNLKPADYFLRILVDNNDDGYWETSSFTENRYAEDVYLFKKGKDQNPMTKVNIRPMWEINEKWDLNAETQGN